MADQNWLSSLTTTASGWLSEAAKLAEHAGGTTVWLAVTGLSRSGKTVFLTSLIHNILSAAHNPNRMPLLRVVSEGRLLSARLEGARAQMLPRFPYRENLETMAGLTPAWPPGTQDISEIGIEIRFMPADPIGKLLQRIGGHPATLSLRIVDYPGEWLVDLPMMTQSFAQWSRATLALYRKGVRAEGAGAFLSLVAQHRHDAPASDETAKQLHDSYRDAMIAARDKHALCFLQPGRFLCPGNLADVPYLWFAPVDFPDGVDEAAAGTLGALMADRFEVYKREVVARFYQDHFRRYARQIVLVDVLRALLAGREAFDDTRLAIETILQSFRYGGGGMISQLVWGAHVDKVLFAATKADHVPDIQRDHLAELLRNMAAFPAIEVRGSNARIDVTALASVASTAQDSQEIDGQKVQVVIGRPVGSNRQAKFFVGTVPIKPPRADAWNQAFLNVPVFEPPAIDPSPIEGVPHINLDVALEFLLGDRLR